jgi:6-phosphogluconolactonase
MRIFKTPEELAEQFAIQLMNEIQDHSGEFFHLAISGGKTPDILFSILAEKYPDSELWQKLQLWWVDERMVPRTHAESNFGVVQKLLLSKISIPEENIHRIKGENDPEAEALSYSKQIQDKLPERNGWPQFDLILLGMGDDGHTASIFPNQLELLDSDQICEVATHPDSGQKRVTLTGKVLNNSSEVFFLVTGRTKTERVSEILEKKNGAEKYPASHISPDFGDLKWYLDEAAAKKI